MYKDGSGRTLVDIRFSFSGRQALGVSPAANGPYS